MRERSTEGRGWTVGLDVGDRYSHYAVVDGAGGLVKEGRIPTTRAGLRRQFGKGPAVRIALEVGTHSPWASRLLGGMGHEVLVANPRKLRMIYQSRSKQNRLRRCSTRRFAQQASGQIPPAIGRALEAVLVSMEAVSAQIRQLDRRVEEMCETTYPETKLLRQVSGVGPKVALAYVLTLQSPDRFRKGRCVGAYLGLVPARRQSGQHDPQLRITKEGDGYVRRLLVQAAQYQLGPFGPDSQLKRFGQRLGERGGRNAKKRAVVAVARKLAVLLHRLWRTGEVYEPIRQPARGLDAAPAA